MIITICDLIIKNVKTESRLKMNKTVILGIDGWYPQVDGGTNVVLNYREWLKDMYDCYIVAPSYGKKADEEGEKSIVRACSTTSRSGCRGSASATPCRALTARLKGF